MNYSSQSSSPRVRVSGGVGAVLPVGFTLVPVEPSSPPRGGLSPQKFRRKRLEEIPDNTQVYSEDYSRTVT
jgi:hypothetical protein